MTLTVIILTKDESLHIRRAIESVLPCADEIIVLDSFSSDNTLSICGEYGVRVFTHRFINQAQQITWALENIDVESKWVMRLDADEVIEPDLAREIAHRLPSLPDDVVGINLERKHIFMGRWVRHGGRFFPFAFCAYGDAAMGGLSSAGWTST